VDRSNLLVPFSLSVIFTVYNEIRTGHTVHGLPYPKAFLFPLIVYGGLAVIATSETFETAAVLAGWGFLIAQVLFGLSTGKKLPLQKQVRSSTGG
jgi:FtsH-binding integral membrane protein